MPFPSTLLIPSTLALFLHEIKSCITEKKTRKYVEMGTLGSKN